MYVSYLPCEYASTSNVANGASTGLDVVKPASGVKKKHRAVVKHKRKYCKVAGCCRIVKSQGCCQRHGAKTRLCSVVGCGKQAQGGYEGMCKSHFREAKKSKKVDCTGRSESSARKRALKHTPCTTSSNYGVIPSPAVGLKTSVYEKLIPASAEWRINNKKACGQPSPLVQHLQNGFESGKPAGWHRNEERLVRGLSPVDKDLLAKFDEWEQELAFAETMIITGAPNADAGFRYLAHGWGREEGFQSTITKAVCWKRGRANSIDSSEQSFPSASTSISSPDGTPGKESLNNFSSLPTSSDGYSVSSYNLADIVDHNRQLDIDRRERQILLDMLEPGFSSPIPDLVYPDGLLSSGDNVTMI